MRKNFDAKTYVMPTPVLMIGTYDENNIPNIMNAAWGGTYDENQIFICLSTDHKTTDNIVLNKEFTVSFAEEKNEVESDYFGIDSGRKINKVEKANFHHSKSERINAPIFDEYSLTLECRVASLTSDTSGATTYVVADIVGISADEAILSDGKIDTNKLHLLCFDPVTHSYRSVGNIFGKAFKDGLKLR